MKPWDNERTPMTDAALEDFDGSYLMQKVLFGHARELERRFRRAEALIEETVAGYEAERGSAFDWVAWYDKASAHHTASKEETK